MLKQSLTAIILTITVFFFASAVKAEQVDVFVMAGQSNMLGNAGDANSWPVDKMQYDNRIGFYWVAPKLSSSNKKWTQLRPQGGLFPRGHFGPEVTFSRSLVMAKVKPFIFKYSQASASIAASRRVMLAR